MITAKSEARFSIDAVTYPVAMQRRYFYISVMQLSYAVRRDSFHESNE